MNIAPSTMGSYLQNTREPDFETLKRLAKYFATSIDYLLDYRTGHTDNHQEDEVLPIFRSITAEQRELYIEQGKVFIKLNKKIIVVDFCKWN